MDRESETSVREIAYIPLTPLGDVICCMNQLEHLKKIYALEAAAKIYAPCRITVFASEITRELFKACAFADRVIEFRGGETELPDLVYDAVFNYRYDTASLDLLRKMKYETAYGYE